MLSMPRVFFYLVITHLGITTTLQSPNLLGDFSFYVFTSFTSFIPVFGLNLPVS